MEDETTIIEDVVTEAPVEAEPVAPVVATAAPVDQKEVKCHSYKTRLFSIQPKG
jgi:hypothetical protein